MNRDTIPVKKSEIDPRARMPAPPLGCDLALRNLFEVLTAARSARMVEEARSLPQETQIKEER